MQQSDIEFALKGGAGIAANADSETVAVRIPTEAEIVDGIVVPARIPIGLTERFVCLREAVADTRADFIFGAVAIVIVDGGAAGRRIVEIVGFDRAAEASDDVVGAVNDAGEVVAVLIFVQIFLSLRQITGP